MPFPMRLARFNRRVTNRVARPLAGRVPPLALVEHRGRRTGRTYRTPVVVFRAADGYVVALTYGPGTDWVRNVLAAGGCTLVRRGRPVALAEPRLARGVPPSAAVPAPVRWVLRAAGVHDYLTLRRA